MEPPIAAPRPWGEWKTPDPASFPPPEPPAPPAPPTPPSRRRAVGVVAGVAVVAALLAGGVWAWQGRGGGDGGPDHPDDWDPRVRDLVAFVEGTRGLRFEHPVAVELLAEEDYLASLRRGGTITDEERRQADGQVGVLRALGSMSGEFDLAQAVRELGGEGTLGVYDPVEERIRVRGDRLTLDDRATLVHELTHALHDQHFTLDRPFATSGEALAYRALTEADAMRVQEEWESFLSDGERADLDEERAEDAEAVDEPDPDAPEVPAVFGEVFMAPYVFGPAFLDAVVAEGGDEAVDDAFRDPPRSEEQLILPLRYRERDRVTAVAPPLLRAGERELAPPDSVGMATLLLVLSGRLGYEPAWTAVDGWAGDSAATFERDGRACIRMAVDFDEGPHQDEFVAAASAWASDVPGASVTPDGPLVVVESCDPGADFVPAPPPGAPAFELLAMRAALVVDLSERSLTNSQATCVIDRLYNRYGTARLYELRSVVDPADPRMAELDAAVAEVGASCI